MTGTEFAKALEQLQYTGARFARLIAIRPNTVSGYKMGHVPVPEVVAALVITMQKLATAETMVKGLLSLRASTPDIEKIKIAKESKPKAELKPFRFIPASSNPTTKQLIPIPAPIDPRRAQPKSKYGGKPHAKHVQKAEPGELSYSPCDD